MKKMNNLKLIFTLLTLAFFAVGSNAQIDSTSIYECIHTGTVVDYSGLDGCGYVIELDDGNILEPVEIVPDIYLYDSMRVKVGYEYMDGVVTSCMVGTPVAILCIEEWGGSVECQAAFEYSMMLNEEETDDSSSSYIPTTTYFFYDVSEEDVISRQWTVNDSIASTDTAFIIELENPGLYEICLTIETESGCISTFCENILSDTISNCEANFWYYSVDSIIWELEDSTDIIPYEGITYQFMDASKGSFIDSYFWDFGDGSYSYEANPVHAFPYPGVFEVSLTIGSSVTGCESVFTQIIEVDTIIYECEADFWYYSLDSIIWELEDSTDSIPNEGYTYQFMDASKGSFIDSYYWDFGDGSYSYEANPVHTFLYPGVFEVSLTISSSVTGCQSGYTQYVEIDTMAHDCEAFFISCTYTILSDSALEDVAFYDDSIPMPTETYIVGFKNLSTSSGYAYYSWNFGDGNYSDQKNPVHKYYWPGRYYVCLTVYAENGCYDTYCQYVNVGVDDCEVEFTYNIAVPDCEGFQVAHAFMAPFTDDIEWYSWDFGDGSYSGESNPFHVFESYGTYEVCLEVQFWNGCIARSCQEVSVEQDIINSAFTKRCGVSPVRELEAPKALSMQNLYPVPATDELNFELNSTVNQSALIEIYGLDGRKYNLAGNVNLIEGENLINVPLNNLETGIYLYKVITKEGILEGQITVVQ